MRLDDTRSVATIPNYKCTVSVCGISSTEFETTCVSQTVDIKRLNLGSSYLAMDIPCLNSSSDTEDSVPYRGTQVMVLKTVYLTVEHK
jgi:hypothetical protein